MDSIRVPAYAKVNLRLDVFGKRPDGYHELRTIFQAITLHDSLRISRVPRSNAKAHPGGIEMRIDGDSALAAVPAQKNLVWRAADALSRELKLSDGVRIEMTKRIPVGRGLGGGSSDAAAVLAGLSRLADRSIAQERLLEIAAGLGADVPFFLFGGRALGTGRGDEIYPQADLPRREVLVVSPRDTAVITRDAYIWLKAPRLTKGLPVTRLWSFCALCWSPQDAGLSNDFEAPVFRRHPRLAEIRRILLEQGAVGAALAGSGSAVFGLFRNPAQARRTAKQFPEDQVFLCATLSRPACVRALWGPGGIERAFRQDRAGKYLG